MSAGERQPQGMPHPLADHDDNPDLAARRLEEPGTEGFALRPSLSQVEFWLQLCFAVIACLGGLVLATGDETETIPVIAVFFSVFGFVFVDRLNWFHLPPIGAYIAMGLAAVLCVQDFWDAHRTQTMANKQMVSVAMLLVLVQAILMLQRKTPRIFEQLAVFCLLQLVVGAVFNDAINFGLLLLPIGMFGAWAMSVMSSVTASDGIQSRAPAQADVNRKEIVDEGQGRASLRQRWSEHWIFQPIVIESDQEPVIQSWSSDSIPSLASSSGRLQRFAVIALTPAILSVGAMFFYALPRTTDAARLGSRGKALVGFDDEVRLDQFGQMLQNSSTALRVRLKNRRTGTPFRPVGEIYLRGRVLEKYEANFSGFQPTSSWVAKASGPISGRQRLPLEYIPSRVSDKQFYDEVDVEISCSAMQSDALFAIAPYHVNGSSSPLIHAVDRWTVRRKDPASSAYAPLEYGFGTNAFSKGVQSDLLTRTSTLGRMLSSTIGQSFGFATEELLPDSLHRSQVGDRVAGDRSFPARSRRYPAGSYLAELTEFDSSAMPSIARLSNDIVSSIPPSRRTTVTIARAFERHLSLAGGYSYTLNLDAVIPDGVDPIEHFVSANRRGHCQYFASALAMMLRSVNVPARLVVGYRTSEYNDLGQYVVARQLHAHAWVETLVDRNQLDDRSQLFGQAPSSEYWLRLDPTPGDGNASANSGGNVDQVMNMAENLWEKYVVTMDARRQPKAVTEAGDQSMLAAAMRWIPRKVGEIRSGRFRLGNVSFDGRFSWKATLLGITLAVVMLGLTRLPALKWVGRRFGKKSLHAADKPSVAFYATALEQVAKIGIERKPDQTPDEFLELVRSQRSFDEADRLSEPLSVLTNAFYRVCYSRPPLTTDLMTEDATEQLVLDQASKQLKSEVQMILRQQQQQQHST